MSDTEPAPKRLSRWGLYLPFLAFGLICAGWSAWWLVVRGAVASGIDREIAQAATRGDIWTCANRTVTGFPFRIEVRCTALALTRTLPGGSLSFATGPLTVVGQPQRPSHIIAEAAGPARVSFPDGRVVEARWDTLEASRRMREGQLERFALIAKKPVVTVTQGGATTTLSAGELAVNARRNPARPAQDDAVDLAVQVAALVSGELDALLGDANASTLELLSTISRASVFATGLTPANLEAWRAGSGAVEITRLNLRKGVKQLDATGRLAIDANRRLTGRIEPSVANIDQFAGIRLRGGAMDLAAALSGRPAPASADALRPLPALEARDGRVFLGPIRLPLPALEPLY
jgi:hypothetical protein